MYCMLLSADTYLFFNKICLYISCTVQILVFLSLWIRNEVCISLLTSLFSVVGKVFRGRIFWSLLHLFTFKHQSLATVQGQDTRYLCCSHILNMRPEARDFHCFFVLLVCFPLTSLSAKLQVSIFFQSRCCMFRMFHSGDFNSCLNFYEYFQYP